MNARTGLMRRTLVALLLLGMVAAPLAIAGYHEGGKVALGGYCPVAYAAMGKAVEGSAKFASEYQGKTYHLANAKAKKMFDAAPDSYAVAYDGWCATAVANGMKVASDPTIFEVRDGKTYLFSNEKAKAMFTADAAGLIAQADKNWHAIAHKGHGH
jgi:YHS domain-containing protein